MKAHELKCWPEYFREVQSCVKTFEYRKDDRGVSVGDLLWLREYDPQQDHYSGRVAPRRVTYIARGGLIPEGFCVMSIVPDSTFLEQ